jgi:hypothetical protein
VTELVDGRFRLLERIGAGGMGVVYRAIDETTGETVACKILDARAPHEIERAQRESAALARLSHPTIVRHIADGITADGLRYLAMAWVDGQTAAERMVHEGFSIREAVALTTRIATALAAAHASNVIHRDVKPSNVLLAGNDPERAVLIDFGVSRLGDVVRTLTRTGTRIGTPGYMSPEQARGERDIGPAVDVFALGCVLYECATGRPAFSGSSAPAVITKILLANPTPFAALCPAAPPALCTLVAHMLAKHARNRLPDGAAVVEAIARLGDLPDVPRQHARAPVSAVTEVSGAGDHHCIVAASRGVIDDVDEPPTPEQKVALEQIAAARGACLEVLATGGVVAQLTGDPSDTAHRAALVALAMRDVLPGWSVVVSSLRRDVGVATEDGTALLASATMTAIFRKADGVIDVDGETAKLLEDEFEIVREGRRDPGLVRSRR